MDSFLDMTMPTIPSLNPHDDFAEDKVVILTSRERGKMCFFQNSDSVPIWGKFAYKEFGCLKVD